MAARPVHVATGTADGEEVEASLHFEARLCERAAVEIGTRSHRDPGDDLVAVAERHAQDRVHLFAFFDEPHHLLCGVAELFGCATEVK